MRKVRKHYVDYDKEKTFTKCIDQMSESEMERMLLTGAVSWMYARKTITSGKVTEVEIYPEFTKAQIRKEKTIVKKQKISQKNLNDKNARKKLVRLVNANFGDGDLWVTLTYDDEHMPSSMQEATKRMNYYIKKLNRIRKKKGLKNCRYIYVTEMSKRVHQHIVMDGDLSMDEVESAWPYGRRNNTRRISEDDEGLTGLARYLAKDPKGKRRYNCSKGLKQPKERKSHQITMKRIRLMREDENELERYIRDLYPDRPVAEMRRYWNPVNGMYYYYVRLGVKMQI